MIPVSSTIDRSVLVATLAIAALAAASCGGGDSKPSSDSFWVDTYNPAGLPSANATPTTQHVANLHPGNCLNAACHVASGTAVLKFAYGGVVYKADGTTRAPNVQVGVVAGSYKSFVYSRIDGLYWAEGVPTDVSDWTKADLRIRNANGEKKTLATDPRGADCDSCHMESGGSAQPLKTL
jgi:hypothetical protein